MLRKAIEQSSKLYGVLGKKKMCLDRTTTRRFGMV